MIRRVGKASESCIVCARRAGASAIGQLPRVGWYCDQCGIQIAEYAYAMTNKDFDTVEQAACKAVAAILNSTDDQQLTIPRDEVPLFVSWVVDEFAKQMREYVRTGEVPL
jgi:ribosomal protein L37AE/L43A